MRFILFLFSTFLVLLLLIPPALVRADIVDFSDGGTTTGTVLRTNGNDVLILLETDTLLCARSNIQSITFAPVESSPTSRTARLPNFKTILLALNKQTWAANLKQVPATVIDAGPMKNVPYVSYRCANDYEINIYGDLSQPSAIEAGVYGKLAKDELAKNRCENFLHGLLLDSADKSALRGLDWQADVKVWKDFTFEVTPPTAPDAYGGWWMSIYSTAQLDTSRASDAELKQITTSQAAERESGDLSSWSSTELSLARKARPTRISFKNGFGTTITNAEVVKVNEGVSLDWRDALGSGTVRLADLSKELQDLFNFDPEKDATESERRARIAAQQRAFQHSIDSGAPPLSSRPIPDSGYGMGYGQNQGGRISGGGSTYSGGPVFVRGYTRSNGTYVRGHTRSAPRRR
ncbi:MAG: hypothetical protein V4697_00970 [Patescibacteria group bacterium]